MYLWGRFGHEAVTQGSTIPGNLFDKTLLLPVGITHTLVIGTGHSPFIAAVTEVILQRFLTVTATKVGWRSQAGTQDANAYMDVGR